MQFFYPFFMTFIIVFFSELGDKTQLLVLSFSAKNKAKNVLLGVALGTFFSHGIAILFGSKIAGFNNEIFNFYLKLFTYFSFLLFGFLGFFKNENSEDNSSKSNFLRKISHFSLNPIFIVAVSIFVGEIGDKTFLASLGLGVQYPDFKFLLIWGSICGMVASNLIAIFFGKLLGSRFKQSTITILSNIIFIIFGFIGLINFIFNFFAYNN